MQFYYIYWGIYYQNFIKPVRHRVELMDKFIKDYELNKISVLMTLVSMFKNGKNQSKMINIQFKTNFQIYNDIHFQLLMT